MEADDTYQTIGRPSEGVYKEKGSKFAAYAYPIDDQEQVKPLVDALKKEYYDARHHCYAWRLGPQGEHYRVNDDGEPSGSAGKPILGQMLSRQVTDLLIVVVRYFGGTKLGVPGLINAYRQAAADALDNNTFVTRTVDIRYRLCFPYEATNEVMKLIKDEQPEVLEQRFDTTCTMELSIRKGARARFEERLSKIEGVGHTIV